MIARIESSSDLTGLCGTLKELGFEVAIQNNKAAFIHRKNTAIDALRNALKSAKDANRFSNQIKIEYGTSTASC